MLYLVLHAPAPAAFASRPADRGKVPFGVWNLAFGAWYAATYQNDNRGKVRFCAWNAPRRQSREGTILRVEHEPSRPVEYSSAPGRSGRGGRGSRAYESQNDRRKGDFEQPRGHVNQREPIPAQRRAGEATRNQSGAGRTDQRATEIRNLRRSSMRTSCVKN